MLACITLEFLYNVSQRSKGSLVVNLYFEASDSFDRNGDHVSGKFSLATQGFVKSQDFHNAFLDVWYEINLLANRAFLKFFGKGFLMPTFRQQFLGAFGFF